VRAGLGWVPQEREVFPSLTVEENLTVISRLGGWNLKRVYDFFPRLRERRGNYGNQLSGGEQQMLAIGRALMTNPKLLLLDEPMEGLAPIIVEELAAAIRRLCESEGLASIVVEQHPVLALEMTHKAIVLERGTVVHAGPSAELAADRNLLEGLLGVGIAEQA
jgi:branched-chain amino acid transport system ATP-binding protein